MAHEVAPGLFVGKEEDCAMPDGRVTRGGRAADWSSVVHCAKYPCHAELLGYAGKGKMDPGSPEYLVAKRAGGIILNMIDAEERYFRWEVFTEALDHIEAALLRYPKGTARVLVHCNQGMSRSPSIALLYLAKRTTRFDPLDRATYDAARKAFTVLYPHYKPGNGIAAFLDKAWDLLA